MGPRNSISPFYLLGDPSSFARGANIHPLSSLVSYQLYSPCWLTHPEGTPQIKLHIYIDDINTSAVPSDTLMIKALIYSGQTVLHVLSPVGGIVFVSSE
jgi:hypothetical protein